MNQNVIQFYERKKEFQTYEQKKEFQTYEQEQNPVLESKKGTQLVRTAWSVKLQWRIWTKCETTEMQKYFV